MTLFELIDLAKSGINSRFESEPDTFIGPHAYAITADGQLTVMEMPNFNMQEIREELKYTLPKMQAVAVVVVTEMYQASFKDPAEEALCIQLQAEGRLQDAPRHCLRDAIVIQYETPDCAIQGIRQLITVAPDGTRSLEEPWQEQGVKLPRPTFRRFFPEARQ